MKCPKCNTHNPSDSKYCKECAEQLPSSAEIPLSPTKTFDIPIEELTTGSTFARRYQIIEELGEGGMAKVYKALDTEINEKVALKLIKPEIAADKRTIERFQNELKFARKVSHKNVCRMFDLNKEEGGYYITMEYVSGEDLKSMIRMSKQLSMATAIDIAGQVCEGLVEAHRLGIIHRDLKPSNIMIDKEGNAQIMDFGIARSLKAKGITDTGLIVGTPEYMSPEQVEGKEADQRSDIYTLGVILYEMVTGRIPFEGDTALGIAMKHKSEAPKDPKQYNAQIPDSLSRVILTCLEKEREKRYKSAKELLSELSRIEETKPETIKTPEWKYSIAVLPFKNMSADPEQEYFCEGIAEELINALTHISDLRIVARTSAFSFKGKDVDIGEIGKKLKVDKVLEGSVRKAGNRLRITAQLINVNDGYHLWSERYDRNMEDVFAIQDEISQAIVDELKLKLLGEEKKQLRKRYTDDVEAYNLYLEGRFFYGKGSFKGYEKSIECFNHALERDSCFALAYAGLGASYIYLGFYGFLPPKDAFPKAKSLTEKALEIDDTLAIAHAMKACVSTLYDWDWVGAERGFKKALELSPRDDEVHWAYSGYLAARGRLEEAIREIKKAIELNPLSSNHNYFLGVWYRYARRYEEAIKQLKKTLEMEPNHGMSYHEIGFIYTLKGEYKEALKKFQDAIRLTGGLSWSFARLGHVYAKLGKKEKAESLLRELEDRAKKEYVRPSCFSTIHRGLGDMEKAFEYLNKAYEEHDPIVSFLKVLPEYDQIRSNPRFKTLLKKIGLE